MITQDTIFNIKNRSSSMVVYKIPELNIRREFAPGEMKKVPYSELEKLTYQPGGKELIENFLQILEERATESLNIQREPEYNMSEEEIKNLLLSGSLDAFLDALDFAPIGVIDLIKAMSVQLPLTDLNKRRALRDKTGFDVDRALAHIEEERAAVAAQNKAPEVAPTRRVKVETADQPARRTLPNYKIVSEETKEN